MTLKPEVTERMNIPRAAYIRFPYGNPLGMKDDPEMQCGIMHDALRLVYILDTPGQIAQLPYRWRGQAARDD